MPLDHSGYAKLDDNLPLFRQNEIFARRVEDTPASTVVDWCGRSMQVLQPIIERIKAHIMASDLLHTDNTPIRVPDPAWRDKGGAKA